MLSTSRSDTLPLWTGWLLAAGVVVLLAGAPLPLTDGDAALYANIARNVLESGDWVTLRYRGDWIVDKPPLTIWLLTISIAAFGTSEWALRAWHLAMALGTVLATYALARLALPTGKAALAALVLLTSSLFFYQSLVPQQDVPLTLFVTLAIYWHLRWERDGRPWYAIASWISVALAILARGLIGLVLPLLVVGAHLLVDRPPLPRRAIAVTAAGIAGFLLIASPWFVAGALRQGRAFIDTFFLGGSLGVGRYFHALLDTPIPQWIGVFAYVLFLPLGLLPWAGWLWPALKEGWSRRRGGPSALWVCTLWVVAVVVFLSLSWGDKVIRYLLPVFPPLAMLIAHVIGEVRWTRTAAFGSLASAALPGAFLVWTVAQSPAVEVARYLPLALWFLVVFALGLITYPLAVALRRPRTGAILLTAFAILSYGVLVISIARTWDKIFPWRPLARVVNRLEPLQTPVLIVGPENTWADYYIERPVEFVGQGDLAKAWEVRRVIAVIPSEQLAALPNPPQPVIKATAPAGLLLVTNFPSVVQPAK